MAFFVPLSHSYEYDYCTMRAYFIIRMCRSNMKSVWSLSWRLSHIFHFSPVINFFFAWIFCQCSPFIREPHVAIFSFIVVMIIYLSIYHSISWITVNGADMKRPDLVGFRFRYMVIYGWDILKSSEAATIRCDAVIK